MSKEQEYPFIAPCKKLTIKAPIIWLKVGLSDVLRAPLASLSYGLLMSLMVMLVFVMVWQYGGVWLLMSLLCGFVF